MKKTYLFAIALMMMGAVGFSQLKISLRIKGSDTCLPLVQKESENYMNKNSNTSLMVTGGGSGVGLAALITGTTDIAMSSRKIKMDEKLKMQDVGKAFSEKIIARDALAVIVNPGNNVNQLTREQIEGIFTGKIKNWQEVGGENLSIVLYSRESSSGTYEYFKVNVLKSKNYSSSALLMPASGAIVQSVSQTKGAIGYVGIAYVEKSVKAISVSYDKGKSYIAPSVETALNGTYPVIRPLYFYYLTSIEAQVTPFINYILSSEGQNTVKKEGYVPLK